MRREVPIGLTIIASMLVLEASAHHSFDFSRSEEGERFVIGEGAVSEVKLVNPHSGLFIDTVNENGESEIWGLETRPAVLLLRRGWDQETLQIGQRVTFGAERLREESRAWWRTVLIHSAAPQDEGRLFIELESLPQAESEEFGARFESLPPCEGISELCYRVSQEALQALQAKYGVEGYLVPGSLSE